MLDIYFCFKLGSCVIPNYVSKLRGSECFLFPLCPIDSARTLEHCGQFSILLLSRNSSLCGTTETERTGCLLHRKVWGIPVSPSPTLFLNICWHYSELVDCTFVISFAFNPSFDNSRLALALLKEFIMHRV